MRGRAHGFENKRGRDFKLGHSYTNDFNKTIPYLKMHEFSLLYVMIILGDDYRA